MRREWLAILTKEEERVMDESTCIDCCHATDNAHYGECGDLATGYCNYKDVPINLDNGVCENYKET